MQEAQQLEQGGVLPGMGSGYFLRMQKAWSGLSGSVPSFFLFLSKTFPLWQPV